MIMFFQEEDGRRDGQEARGLGDGDKRQGKMGGELKWKD